MAPLLGGQWTMLIIMNIIAVFGICMSFKFSILNLSIIEIIRWIKEGTKKLKEAEEQYKKLSGNNNDDENKEEE